MVLRRHEDLHLAVQALGKVAHTVDGGHRTAHSEFERTETNNCPIQRMVEDLQIDFGTIALQDLAQPNVHPVRRLTGEERRRSTGSLDSLRCGCVGVFEDGSGVKLKDDHTLSSFQEELEGGGINCLPYFILVLILTAGLRGSFTRSTIELPVATFGCLL